MGTAGIQLIDWVKNGQAHYFLIFFVGVFIIAFIKRHEAYKYVPFSPPLLVGLPARPTRTSSLHTAELRPLTACGIIPVVNEDPDLFRLVLRSSHNRGLDDMVVVINGRENPELEAVCHEEEFGGRIRVITRMEPGKRGAMVAGAKSTKCNILVVIDSDTIARGNTITNLLIPFSDPQVGGVTTAQSIRGRNDHWLKRFTDWMEDVRVGEGGSMRAMSVHNCVGCLPGRMIAIRRRILLDNEEDFLGLNGKGKSLGVYVKASDDRTVTNYALMMGYHTVVQTTAEVQTDAPTSLWVWIKQQLRWSRGSQYNTLRMMWFYIRKHPYLAFAFGTEIIIPFWWLGTLFNAVWKSVVQGPQYYGSVTLWWEVALVSAGMLASAFIRNLPHFQRYPWDIMYLVPYVLLLSFVLTPIRIIGFFICAKDASWGTRKDANATVAGNYNIRGTIPWLIGAGLIEFFCAAGPLIETRQIFLEAVSNNLTPIILAHPVLYVWALLVRFVRWRYATQIKTAQEGFANYLKAVKAGPTRMDDADR